MVRGNVSLNSVGLVCDTFERDGVEQLVHRERKEPFSTAFRTTGNQQQSDLVDPSSLFLLPPILGMGVDRIPLDQFSNPAEYRKFKEGTLETRWSSGVYLPILEEDSDDTGLEVIRGSVEYKSDLWAIWEDISGAGLVSRKYSPAATAADWTGGGDISEAIPGTAVTGFVVGLDIIVHKDRLVVLMANDQNHRVAHSTDGITWSAPATPIPSGLLADAVTSHEDTDAGLLASIGGEVVSIVADEDSGSITFFSDGTATPGNAWTDEAVDIISGGGPKGVVVISGTDRLKKLLVGTREGIWEVDVSGGTWALEHIRPLTPHDDNCRKMTLAPDGSVWFSVGVSDSEPFIVRRLFVSGGQWVVDDVPNPVHLRDGIPAEMLGPVRWMKPSPNGFVYASIGGGAASRNARVICHNGLGWHSMRRHGTVNQKIQWIELSGEDDDTQRLHYAIRTSSSASNTKFLTNPNANPLSGVPISRESSGYVDWPRIDNGMPSIDAAWLRIVADAEGLTVDTTGEYIAVAYGKDGEARTTNTDLSNSSNIESDNLTVTWASGVGVSSKTIALRTTFHHDATGDPTDTPKLNSLEINFDKKPGEVERFTFLVNIEETAEITELPPEKIIENLETARDLVPLVVLDYANMGAKNVRIRHLGWREAFDVEAAPDTLVQRVGSVLVVCEEII